MNKKKVLIGVIVVIGLFLIINVTWFIWRNVTFGRLSDGMEQTEFSRKIVPRYFETDEEGYTYYVKYPDYLSFTSNITVGIPSYDVFDDTLIIWIRLGRANEYGVIIHKENMEYRIPIDKNGDALDSSYDEMIESRREIIETLFQRANSKWNI